jgi:predicted enzyme related to lactoylglutathione lyase
MGSPARERSPVDVLTERNSVPSSVTPMIVTHDLERLTHRYAGIAGATETSRMPDDKPTFYLGLRVGDFKLSIVSDGATEEASTGRVPLNIEVPDVDAARTQVESHGGRALAPADDMPWGRRIAHVKAPDGNALT